MNMEYEKHYNKIRYDQLRKSRNGNDEASAKRQESRISRETREKVARKQPLFIGLA